MFATNVAPASSRRGTTSPMNRSTPMFCRPIALSIPDAVSTMRPGGFPGVGARDSPFMTTAPHAAPPADPEAARHVFLQRHLRRDAPFARRRGDLLEHLPRSAGEDRYPRGRFRGESPQPFQHRLGDAATEPGGSA